MKCRYEVQLLYASIGWSLGATLGYAQAAPHKRMVLCIGDGSFQVYFLHFYMTKLILVKPTGIRSKIRSDSRLVNSKRSRHHVAKECVEYLILFYTKNVERPHSVFIRYVSFTHLIVNWFWNHQTFTLLSNKYEWMWQMGPQDISTMLSLRQNNIIFMINNGGYTIEVGINDGPYNVIKNWDYTAFVDAMHNGDGNCWTTKVI